MYEFSTFKLHIWLQNLLPLSGFGFHEVEVRSSSRMLRRTANTTAAVSMATTVYGLGVTIVLTFKF